MLIGFISKYTKAKEEHVSVQSVAQKMNLIRSKTLKIQLFLLSMKKSFNYNGHSFLYFCNNSTNIKIKPLTYTDLLYLNKNKEELINFILNYLEKEDKVQKNAKNILSFEKYKFMVN
ncbi:hypothetical protein [Candidatus Pelagibacter sp. IMCC9063]|uniref:hypothetical protein n=1 Tax=Pelagibacter sp. (strain IMCC9063) TaxID=1002672 RepID=UPI0005A48A73|nr:hypothetical protein [Candidatus Pelagibacter sp. IMCC9063]